jgi:hypothetical protein
MWAKVLCEREEHVLSLLGGSGCNGARRWAAGDVHIGALIFDASKMPGAHQGQQRNMLV